MDYNIKWANQGGIRESGMTKWIITLHNSDGELVKKIENSERANLNNFSTVNIKLSLTSREAIKQTDTNNVLKVYFDNETDDNKLLQKTMSFDRNRLTIGLNEVKKIDYEVDDVIPMTAKFKGVRGLPAKKFTNFLGHEYVHTQPAKFADYGFIYSIFIYKADLEGWIYFTNDKFEIQYKDDAGFDPDNITKVILKYWHDWEGVIRNGPYTYYIEDKIDMEYWISVYIGRPYTLPKRKPKVGDTFNCELGHRFKIGQGDSQGLISSNESDRNYIMVSENETRWLKNHTNVDLTISEVDNCSAYRYIGIKDKNETTRDSKCGPYNGHKKCPGSMCCSEGGWCGGEVGKKSDYCHVQKWYQDRPSYGYTWTKDHGKRWTSVWGQHFGGSHNFEYDGTNIDGSTIGVRWWGGSWGRDDRKPKKGDIVRCRNNDPMGSDWHIVYYYDGNNTLLYLYDTKVLQEVIGSQSADWGNVGDMVIHNCSGVTLGGPKKSA